MNRYSRKNSFPRYKTATSSFGGVDYSSHLFDVSSSRAIEINNYVFKDGMIQKRCGTEELLTRVLPYQYYPYGSESVETNGINFNGVWDFLAEDGERHLVAHIGNLLYEITEIDSKKPSFRPIVSSPKLGTGKYVCHKFDDYKSSAFVGGRKLWFLGGNKFACVRFIDGSATISLVEENVTMDLENREGYTYIPTTTVGITPENAGIGKRTNQDSPNKMTQWRKNECSTSGDLDTDFTESTGTVQLILDSPIICRNQNKDMDDFKIVIKERGTKAYLKE